MSFYHLQSQRIKGGGASRGERWEGGSLRKDSKFRKGVGAAGYKKSELRRTDRHSFEPGKRGFGWGHCGSPPELPPERLCLHWGMGCKSVGGPRYCSH